MATARRGRRRPPPAAAAQAAGDLSHEVTPPRPMPPPIKSWSMSPAPLLDVKQQIKLIIITDGDLPCAIQARPGLDDVSLCAGAALSAPLPRGILSARREPAGSSVPCARVRGGHSGNVVTCPGRIFHFQGEYILLISF